MDDKQKQIAENKALIEKYPFLKPQFCDEKFEKEYDYSWTELDFVCIGWHKMFLELCEDIKQHLLAKNVPLTDFHFADIKEKWGTLRIEAYGAVDDELYDMLYEAEIRSMLFCPHCGKPTKYVTKGYVLYMCPECVKKSKLNGELLTENDVPYTTIYGDNNEKTIKRSKYDAEFRAQWNGKEGD